jgi:hypothetical protein
MGSRFHLWYSHPNSDISYRLLSQYIVPSHITNTPSIYQKPGRTRSGLQWMGPGLAGTILCTRNTAYQTPPFIPGSSLSDENHPKRRTNSCSELDAFMDPKINRNITSINSSTVSSYLLLLRSSTSTRNTYKTPKRKTPHSSLHLIVIMLQTEKSIQNKYISM